jgi:gliding motility-associated protein GldM
MAGGNVSPRQKMINMMYLVLTALLALNVSAEILKAFHLVEVSMERAGANIDSKNASILAAINKFVVANKNDAKGIAAKASAEKVDKVAKDAVKYVRELKELLIANAGGRKDGLPDGEILDAQNMEKHANYLINQKHGEELRKKIDEWRTSMINALPADKRALVKSDLVITPPKDASHTWESELFEHAPLAAVSTLLTKIENDIKTTEAQVLDELNKDLTVSDFIVTDFSAEVIPENGTYITQGGKYSAKIFLAASSSRQSFDLTVNGSPVKVENGIGMYETTASGEGEKKYTAVITQRKLNGEVKRYEKESSFTVVKPLAVVSATKMNVVYRGLENPISISVPGYSATELIVTSSFGNLAKDGQPGTFKLTVPGSDVTTKELTISVSVKTPDGVKKMGEQKYRLKNVPRPTLQLGGIEVSGPVSMGQVKSAASINTPLKDFVFEGVSYKPTSYQIVYSPRSGPPVVEAGNGPLLSSRMKSILQSVKIGDRIIVTGVKAIGPQGAVPIPSALVVEVK